MNLIFLQLQVLTILAIQYHGSNCVTIFKVCPDGYQLLRFVQPPLATETLQCTLFDTPNCVEQCYWAAIGKSGGGTSNPTRAGLRNRGDCGSYQTQDSDSTFYNADVIGNDQYYHGSAGSTWIEGGYATYINGLNYSTEGNSDQKRCCLSKLYKVTADSCGYSGGSSSALVGYYRWASTIPTDPIARPELFIDTTSTAVQDMANLPGNTNNPVRSNPIVRQLGFNNRGAYDYTIHLCDTERDPAGTCDATTTTTTTNGPTTTTTTIGATTTTTIGPTTTTETVPGIFKVCPDGYQLLRQVQPPLATETLQCTLFETPNCVTEEKAKMKK